MTRDGFRDRDQREPDLNATIARLLGPGGPEVTCEQCFELLDSYVERELSGVDDAMPAMRAHLEGCPACLEDYESLRALVEREAGRPDD